MAAVIWLMLLAPGLLGALALLRRDDPRVRHVPVAAASVALTGGVALLATLGSGGIDQVVTAGGLLRVDALTAYLLTVVGAVAVVATGGASTPRVDGRFSALMALFLAAMTLAVLADNLGVLWVAIEGTTITTAFLVSYGGGRHALEAAWKYVVLGSVGVAIAFLGLVLVFAAGGEAATLSWQALSGGVVLDHDTARVGLALTALGLATKAGLAPMHSWLPDAHSQAPAQVSGLMSGVLLSVAFYGILRVQAVSDAVLGPDLMRSLLTATGLLSLAVAGALMLTQRSYKRLLAYSSIEHMGIVALGAAIGGKLAVTAVLLHVLGHGLAKASLFVVAGRMLTVTGTPEIARVHSLLDNHPSLARPWLAGTTALLGLPPFGLFLTEAAIVVAGFQRGLPVVAGAMLALLLVVFAGLSRHALGMTLTGHGREPAVMVTGDPSSGPQRLVTGTALAVVAVLGLLAWPLRDVLAAAAAVLGVAA